jgi:rhamnosyl/mannosyltransferase
MVPYKGLDVLVRAFANVDATAILVGDGPTRSSVEGLARDTGVGGRVVFAGRVDDDEMVALYQACDAFVLPSVTRAEAFGVVQLEAMAAGRPVVSTALPSGVPWVNQDEVTGLVVPPGDAGALTAALTRLLRDEALRVRMGQAGQARVAAEFTVARMVAATTALYHRLVADAAGAAEPVG